MQTSRIRPALMLLVVVCLVSGPSSAQVQPTTVHNGTVVSDLSGRSGTATLFRINVPSGAPVLDVTLSGGRGDCDLYVRHNQPPTTREHDARSITPLAAERVRIDRPQAGSWYILVFAAADYAGVGLLAQFPTAGGPVGVAPLANNVVQYGLAGGAGTSAYFRIVVPPGATDLQISTSGGRGDCDLYVTPGKISPPERAKHKSTRNDCEERVIIRQPPKGPWFILVHGYKPFKDVRLVAQFQVSGAGMVAAPLTSGLPRGGLAGAAQSLAHFRIVVPNSTAQLVITTSGGRGDCDLYAMPSNLAIPRLAHHKSAGNGTAERIAVSRPAAGPWYVCVYGYAAYADVSLLVTAEQPPPPHPSGRIEVLWPTGGKMRTGGTCPIAWRATPNIAEVRIEYSNSDGKAWAAANFPVRIPAAAGKYVWQIPNRREYYSGAGRLRISGTTRRGRTVSAVSQRFMVLAPVPPPPPPPPPPVPGGDKYENDNTTSRAKLMPVGQTQTHTIYPKKDEDWIMVVNLPAGHYSLQFTHVTVELRGEIHGPRTGGSTREHELDNFKIRKGTGTVSIRLRRAVKFLKFKIEADDDDDKGAYQVTLVKQR